jgi:hypothetical protein
MNPCYGCDQYVAEKSPYRAGPSPFRRTEDAPSVVNRESG